MDSCQQTNELNESTYYSRQVLLEGFGLACQQLLKNKRVLVIGAGGLGCPVLLYLAGAGVGAIEVADGDEVHISNLHRQIIFTTEDLGKNKAKTAVSKLRLHNPFIEITYHDFFVSNGNINNLLHNIDVVIDTTDNFDTRFIVGDATAKVGIPLVYAAIYGFEGQLSVFNHFNGPSLRDYMPQKPDQTVLPNCIANGVIGVVSGQMGLMMAIETLKVLVMPDQSLSGKIMFVNTLTFEKRIFTVQQLETTERKNMEEHKNSIRRITSLELKEWINSNPNDLLLVDVREQFEFDGFNIGGLHVPLRQIPSRISELDGFMNIVFICKSGVRSMNASEYVLKYYPNAHIYNLEGGLLTW